MQDLKTVDDQLTRVLGFFPRVDAKAGGLFAINSAMATIAVLNLRISDLGLWFVGIPATLTVLALLASYYFLYRCNFPELAGGERSLIYFVEIQKRTEPVFIEEYEAAADQAYRRDLLGQIWRNSVILCSKYKAVAASLKWTLAALPPFIALLAANSYLHAAMPIVKAG